MMMNKIKYQEKYAENKSSKVININPKTINTSRGR